jgi:hypothetical protein
MEHFYVKPPKEVCNSVKDYCNWILTQYAGQVRFGWGQDDVIKARQNGFNLNCPIHLAVWQACRERYNSMKTRNFTTLDLIDIIKTKERSSAIKFDRTTICHLIGVLRALGLVYRSNDRSEYEYAFEDIILEKGMDWFLKDNPFIHNPPPLGGFMDECLVK